MQNFGGQIRCIMGDMQVARDKKVSFWWRLTDNWARPAAEKIFSRRVKQEPKKASAARKLDRL